MAKRKNCQEEPIDGEPVHETTVAEQPVEKARRLNNWSPAKTSSGKVQEDDVQENQGRFPPSPSKSESALERPGVVEPFGQKSNVDCETEESTRISQKSKETEAVRWWALHSTWPSNFGSMSFGYGNKRQRVSSNLRRDNRSYSQCRKDGDAPEQYTAAYENYILAKGLHMNYTLGRDHLAEGMQEFCIGLQKIEHEQLNFEPESNEIVNDLSGYAVRNEGIICRDITPLIIPPFRLFRRGEVENLEHVIDEVNADWREQCIIAGPRPRPDLAIGISSSAFSQSEREKLTSYGNCTQFTENMSFPFLMCEVKCGREGLDRADRQSMHSCSIAVRALLQLQRAASKQQQQQQQEQQQRQQQQQQPGRQQPENQQPEDQQSDYQQQPVQEIHFLSGHVLVFSISHNHQDARLYGHFGRNNDDDDDECQWTYHRILIAKFDLTKNGLSESRNFVRNLFKFYLPGFIKRIKYCVGALPESSGPSFAASGITIEEEISSGMSSEPASSSIRMEGMDKLVAQLERMERQMEEQVKERKDEKERMERQMEEQVKERKDEKERMERQMEEQQREYRELMKLVIERTTSKA